MSDSAPTLPPFPSNSDAFKDFQRTSLPPSIPQYKPEIAMSDPSETCVIRPHSNLLAFQPRTRQRLKAETPTKKKPVRRKRKEDDLSSEDEGCEPSTVVANESQAARPLSSRRRSSRRPAPRSFDEFVGGAQADEVELTDDDDFM